MEEECYPAISMNGGSKHQHIIHRQGHVTTVLANGQHRPDTKPPTFAGMSLLVGGQQSLTVGHHNSGGGGGNLVSNNNNHLTVNHNLDFKDASLLGLKGLAVTLGNGGSSSSCHDSSSSSTSASDIDIDETTTVKEEPLSPSSSCPGSPVGAGEGGGGSSHLTNGFTISAVSLGGTYGHSDLVLEHKNGTLQLSPASQSLLKSQQIILTTGGGGGGGGGLQVTSQQSQQQSIVMSKLNIKMEPQSSGFGLPPTPPSSLPSDESEGNQSPEHHVSPMSPPTDSGVNSTSSSRRTSLHTSGSSPPQPGGQSSAARVSSASHGSAAGSSPASTSASQSVTTSTRQPIHTPLISSQPKGSTGTLMLTEEEKRTLLAEGYPIPTRLPLTKAEEKSLKKIRRKIKNKISAQESRRKKKEYMDQLERRVEILVSENLDYRKRVESLEDSNQNLITELSKLRQLISRQAGIRKA
ncbi:cyclic AMP response element-binding protein A [Anopheles cruzii]|uniref:cyclic AMP response element-binding protein A n=1 Tax=Anopheles cruzii TaxID=68878 RepID=UPI0022EC7DB8|nr:cyclic AMP response element-binding protein A [Anopheles cruzii]